MTTQIMITLIILVVMFIAMIINKLPVAVVVTLTGIAYWLTGSVQPGTLYSNFGGATIILLIVMSLEVQGLEATGLIDKAAAIIYNDKVCNNERLAIFVSCLFVGFATGFLSNTALMVMMIPVVAGAAVKSNGKIRPKYLILAMAGEATLGCGISLIGGAPILAASGALETAGYEPFTFFQCAPLTVVSIVIGAIYYSTIGYSISKKFFNFEDPLYNENTAKEVRNI